MRINEIAPSLTDEINRLSQQQSAQQKRQPVNLTPTDAARGKMRRELAKKIAKSQEQLKPTSDDLAIAFTRACQARRAVDDAAQQTGDYRPKRFNG